MNKNAPFWERGAGETGCCHIQLWEKTHRALQERGLHSVSHLQCARMGDRIAMVHSSLFITRILGKRNIGGVCHPLCAFHISGFSLQMTQAYDLAWRRILSDPVISHLEVSEVFSKAISKTLVSVWETNVTQGQWLLLWDHDLMCLCAIFCAVFCCGQCDWNFE